MSSIKEFFPSYFVTTEGDIYHRYKNGKVKILKGSMTTNGYRLVCLPDGKRRFIHKIVAEAFRLNLKNRTEVNHENGIKTDNRAINLSWVTHGENLKHAYRKGLRVPARETPVAQLDLGGTVLQQFHSMCEAERKTGIYATNICQACKGKVKTAGGYIWKYN